VIANDAGPAPAAARIERRNGDMRISPNLISTDAKPLLAFALVEGEIALRYY